jgi:hypothetical protein
MDCGPFDPVQRRARRAVLPILMEPCMPRVSLPAVLLLLAAPCRNPAQSVFTSNLPIVVIDTNGRQIPDADKIDARMKVIDHPDGLNRPSDAEAEYDGPVGIEVRGHHSSGFPQQPYQFETRDGTGANRNVSLLGMPEDNDWILLSNYNDKSLVRNSLAFDLFRRMGHYAPRARLCEVVLNSEYRGIYLFTEKIKPGRSRVDIATLNPDENAGDDLTGGYILKIDYHDPSNSWLSTYPPLGYPKRRVYFVYVFPRPASITTEQKTYIQDFVREAEDVLYGNDFDDPGAGYARFLDVSSFIDYCIIGELSRNVDAYKKSRFFFKDRDGKGGLLHAGPVWDFDWAWKNITECIYSATDGSGWSFRTNDCNPDNNAPDWQLRLLQDGRFTERLIARYGELRTGLLDLGRLNAYIDSVAALTQNARIRHFALWPISQPNAAPEVERPSKSYSEETTRLKEWIRLRIAWLDANVPRLRELAQNQAGVESFAAPLDAGSVRVFPNPCAGRLSFESDRPVEEVSVYDVLGRRVARATLDGFRSRTLRLDGLSAGIYVIRWTFMDGRSFSQKHTWMDAGTR